MQWRRWRQGLAALLVVAPVVAAPGGLTDGHWITERPATTPLPEALTPAELQDLHAQAVASPSRLQCLAWLYRISGPGASAEWPFGVNFQRLSAAVKVGDAVRLGFRMSPGSYDAPGVAHGKLKAQTIVSDFGETFKLNSRDQVYPPRSALNLGIASYRMRVVSQRLKCRHANANCRVYAGPAKIAWEDISQLLRPEGQESAAPGLEFELVVEDMCPATTHGAVEGPWRKARDIGAGSADRINRLFKGITGNPPLAEALK